jgi:hypothetical protein
MFEITGQFDPTLAPSTQNRPPEGHVFPVVSIRAVLNDLVSAAKSFIPFAEQTSTAPS